MTDRRFEMLEFVEAQRFRGISESIVVPVDVVADRVKREPDVYIRHNSH